jgi:hypothetical protein
VFSVCQTDIILYGVDLADYLCEEFHRDADVPREPRRYDAYRTIRFWSAMLELDQEGVTRPLALR